MSDKLDEIELRSEEVQEILERTPHWMLRWGNIIFLAIVLLILFISWFVKYPDIITTQAEITTTIPAQKIYARTTGQLSAILVKDNENVSRNQLLSVLENTGSHEDIYFLKSVVDSIELNKESFYFPIDELPILFLGEIENQYAIFENNYFQYRINKDLNPYSNRSAADSNSLSELSKRLENLKSQKRINKKELFLQEKDLARNKILFDKGVISERDYESEKLEYSQAQRNFENYVSSISQIEESISGVRISSKDNKIERVREEALLFKKVIQSFNQMKIAIKDWEAQYALKSNLNGKISFADYWSVNKSVNAGDVLFNVIPSDHSDYVARLLAPINNSGKIKIGQRVNISLDNYSETEYGVLRGKINKISLVPNEEGFYLIDVELSEGLKTSYSAILEYKQGMTGTAEIITQDLRLIERFFYQFKNVFSRDV